MFQRYLLLLTIGSLSLASADEGESLPSLEVAISEPIPDLSTPIMVDETPTQQTISEVVLAPPPPPPVAPKPKVEKPFVAFTGKVKKNKVRLRANADLDSRVVRELAKNDLLVITGEKNDFYMVEPPAGFKAYVFRSFVLDGVVEGSRVNVRLEPSLDSAVIGHLNSGDRIQGIISALNPKWYEIDPPSTSRLYVAKEFVDYVGSPEMKEELDKRKMAAQQLLDAATLLTQSEMNKSLPEINIARIEQNYETVMKEYADFSDLADKAKSALATLQEDYKQKRLAYLEEKANLPKPEDIARRNEGFLSPTERMKMWQPVEESLFLAWSTRNDERSKDEFYDEQRQNGQMITGVVEPYTSPVKQKPGDYLLRDKELPVAYLYSTHINLSDFVGKKVSVLVTPRTNNNFAFPAYYVLSVE
ncbi:MAG: SH3 domain-containing protein [Verrucomicrobia bacterium]|nr:SH3 domain-containing protein [Verrucomicrobiota bacterium]